MSYTLINLVEKLNIQLFEQGWEGGEYEFTYLNNGYIEAVEFNETLLWNSDTDEREWDDEKDEYKLTVQEYVIKKFYEYRDNLNKITLTLEEEDGNC